MNENNKNEKQIKITKWLIDSEGYIKSNKENILKKYGVGDLELVFSEPEEGKIDLEVQETDKGVIFFIRINKNKFLEREFRKFYKNADEVKQVFASRKEKYLSRLAELGFKDYFKEQAEWLFSEDEQLKEIALKMASKKIDIDDYSEGRSKQIETALTGIGRFDDVEQSGFANYQEYRTYLNNLRDKKERLIYLQRTIKENLRELVKRNNSYDWLENEELEKTTKQIIQEAKETKDEIVSRLVQEYFSSLPKGVQAELRKDERYIERNIRESVDDWDVEIIVEAKKSWTAEQWKKYLPKGDYNPERYSEPYNRGWASDLQLVKINKSSRSYNREENDFYHEIVRQRKANFEHKYDVCCYCKESIDSMGKPSFKLLLATKHRLFYTCSCCENTEIFFDILEWEK